MTLKESKTTFASFSFLSLFLCFKTCDIKKFFNRLKEQLYRTLSMSK